VTTLNHYLPPNLPAIDHDAFVKAVTTEFKRVYEIPSSPPMEIISVKEKEVSEPKILAGIDEMKTWEWEYGSSPEFSNIIQGELSFGSLVGIFGATSGLLII
jgi:lipoate-protein ligase A